MTLSVDREINGHLDHWIIQTLSIFKYTQIHTFNNILITFWPIDFGNSPFHHQDNIKMTQTGTTLQYYWIQILHRYYIIIHYLNTLIRKEDPCWHKFFYVLGSIWCNCILSYLSLVTPEKDRCTGEIYWDEFIAGNLFIITNNVLLAEWLAFWTSTQSTRVQFPVWTHDWFGFQYNRRSRLWQTCVPLQAINAQV